MIKKLYVRNLARSMNSSSLEDIFTTVGDVVSSLIPVDPSTGVSLCVGYVEMSTEQQAADCIDRFHGHKIGGQVLSVQEDKPRPLIPIPPVSSRMNSKTRKPTTQRSR